MSEINRLKRKLRHALTAYRRIADSADCGNALLQEISPAANKLAQEVNETITALRKIDPACPLYRL